MLIASAQFIILCSFQVHRNPEAVNQNISRTPSKHNFQSNFCHCCLFNALGEYIILESSSPTMITKNRVSPYTIVGF